MFLSHANVSYKTCICKCNIKHAYVGDGLKPYWLNSPEKARSSRARMFFKIGVLIYRLSNTVEFLEKMFIYRTPPEAASVSDRTFSKLPT